MGRERQLPKGRRLMEKELFPQVAPELKARRGLAPDRAEGAKG